MRYYTNEHYTVMIMLSLIIYFTPFIQEWLIIKIPKSISEIRIIFASWILAIILFSVISMAYLINIEKAHYIYIVFGFIGGISLIIIHKRLSDWYGPN